MRVKRSFTRASTGASQFFDAKGKRQKQVSRPSNFRRENSKEIPVDLLIEIFSRLTVKDLARCRCLSKLWSSILRRQYFTELFLKISSAQPRTLLTFLHNGMSSSYDCEIHAPVCGFLCSKTSNHVIYNPSTGEYITFPRVRTKKAEKLFKVLCLPTPYVAEDFASLVSTLGMGKVSWRMVECLIPHRPLSTETCIDGVLYYLANCKGKLGVLWPKHIGLGEHTKSLELWVLEDADELKWSKIVYTLPFCLKHIAPNTYLDIVRMTSGGEIVLSTSNRNDPFYIFYYSVVLDTLNVVEIQFGNIAEKAKYSKIYTFIDYVENVERLD
ncbi:PREDICTED: putative F-box protein At3g47020 [Camelina sativa]|uniref:F-box protein At3g47020 n=1 Tax=Camelina sativa TaxID=90675 RepID=A0ABM1RKY6_CAMSA|nr:PREDICTED: putative F-box protein At3g47020 [Camelina sativa]